MRNPSQSTNAARNQSKRPSKNWYQLCLNFVMTCLAAKPAGAPSANRGWDMTPKGHKRTSGTPPKGVPVYWRTGKYGHVALSDGGGYVWSNDIKRRGKIDRVKISYINSKWGARYLGWTTTYIGQSIPGVGGGSLPSDPNAYPGRSAFKLGQSHPSVTRLDKRLIKHGFAKHKQGSKYNPGPTFTKYTKANVRDFQLAQGWTGKDADGYPGPETWKRLFSAPKPKENKPVADYKGARIEVPPYYRDKYGYSQSYYWQSQIKLDGSWRIRELMELLDGVEKELQAEVNRRK